jgi:hypothetical protein
LACNGGRAISALVHDQLSNNHDAHDTLNAHRCGREEQRREAGHRYNPHCGGCYDSGEDQSWSPRRQGPGSSVDTSSMHPSQRGIIRWQMSRSMPEK